MYRMLLPQDLVIGANDAVFVAGTRAAATFSLAPPAGSLAEDPAFVAAQAYLLEDTEMLWYVGVGPLLTFVEKTAALDRPLVTRAAEHIGAVLRLFESAAMSAFTADNGDTVTRFVLTLAR